MNHFVGLSDPRLEKHSEPERIESGILKVEIWLDEIDLKDQVEEMIRRNARNEAFIEASKLVTSSIEAVKILSFCQHGELKSVIRYAPYVIYLLENGQREIDIEKPEVIGATGIEEDIRNALFAQGFKFDNLNFLTK